VERHARLVGLGRAQRSAEAVGAAQDDAVQQVAHRGGAIGADAGEVALDDVALAAVVDLDAGAVEADDVAGPGHRAADGVVVAAGDLDAEQVVALGLAGGGGWLGAVAHAALAVGGDTDEVVLNDVPRGWRGQRADDVNAVDGVARSDVAVGHIGGADLVVGGVLDADAVAAGGEGAIGHAHRAGRIDADEVADDHVAIGLDDDAIAAEVGNVQAADGAAATAGCQDQAVGIGTGAGATQLNKDHGVVRVGLGVGGCLCRPVVFGVAVDDYRFRDV